MAFIERQEDYIEQLEKESRFCRVRMLTPLLITIFEITKLFQKSIFSPIVIKIILDKVPLFNAYWNREVTYRRHLFKVINM